MIDYTNKLDSVDRLGGLVGLVMGLLKSAKDGPVSNYGDVLKRYDAIIAPLCCDTVSDLKAVVAKELDIAASNAVVGISSTQLRQIENLRCSVLHNNTIASVFNSDDLYERFHPKRLDSSDKDTLIQGLLTRPCNQAIYSSIDKHANALIARITELVGVFYSKMSRVKPTSSEAVLAEITSEIEQLLETPPEEELRLWLNQTNVIQHGRVHKRMRMLADAITAQSKRKTRGIATNVLDTVSRLPVAPQLFGQHHPDILVGLGRLESRFNDLSTLTFVGTPPWLGSALSEFGYMVSESVDCLQSMLGIRSTLIAAYNELRDAVE